MKETTNFEFYKELHYSELNRKNEIDSLVKYPTTLLTILIGASFYFFKSENFTDKSDSSTFFTLLLIISTILFGSLIALAIIFLMKMFLNTFEKYEYLPSPVVLKKRENQLYEHYLQHYLEIESKQAEQNAIEETGNEFKKDLINYYINFGTNNQSLNDARIKDYYVVRKCLSFSIIVLSIIGFLILYK